MIYYIHFIVILFLYLGVKSSKIFYRVVYFYSIFIFGQRWFSGEDFIGYIRLFLNKNKVELGYQLFNNFISENHLDFGIIIFVMYSVTLFLFIKTISSFSNRDRMSLLLFCLFEIYFMPMSQMRQFFSIGIFIFCLSFEKKYLLKGLLILLGVSIHKSLIIVLPFFLIPYKKIKFKKVTILIILIILIVFPYIDIKLFLNNINFIYSGYLDQSFAEPLSIFTLIRFYMSICMGIICITFSSNNKIEEKSMIINLFLTYLFLISISFNFGILVRVSFYFRIFEILFIVLLFKKLKLGRDLKRLILSTLTVIIYMTLVIKDPYSIKPYQFRSLRIYDKDNYKSLTKEYQDTNNERRRDDSY